jgi:hypothetical protein
MQARNFQEVHEALELKDVERLSGGSDTKEVLSFRGDARVNVGNRERERPERQAYEGIPSIISCHI